MGRHRDLKGVACIQPRRPNPKCPADVERPGARSERPSAKWTAAPGAAHTNDRARRQALDGERLDMRPRTGDRPLGGDPGRVRQAELVQAPWWIRIYDPTWPA